MATPIYAPCGYQALSPDASTSVGLTVPTGKNVTRCLISVETADVRIRDDGTNPTSSVGMLIKKDSQPWSYEGDLSALKIISTSGTAAVKVLYYAERSLTR